MPAPLTADEVLSRAAALVEEGLSYNISGPPTPTRGHNIIKRRSRFGRAKALLSRFGVYRRLGKVATPEQLSRAGTLLAKMDAHWPDPNKVVWE